MNNLAETDCPKTTVTRICAAFTDQYIRGRPAQEKITEWAWFLYERNYQED
jgi:hypothetical protein